MIARLAVGVAMLATLGVAQLGAAQETGDNTGMRGPRFLVASANRHVPVDVTRTPILAQRISLDLDGATRKEALATISRESGLKLIYGDDLLDPDGRVQLRAERITVAAALTDVLWDAGLDVVLSANHQAALVRRPAGAAVPQAGSVKGRVTDATSRQALVGVEVLLEGTRWHTTTDTTGWYHLAEVDSGTYTLTARRVGYAKQKQQVTVRAAQEDTVNFVLVPAAAKLDELVTTATGQQRRRDLGNAITTIKADSVLRTAPIRNLTDLLATRVPGLTVQHTSGAPGDPARLRLRGLGSVTRGSDPVVVVDGIRVYATQSEARSGNLTNMCAGTSFDGKCLSSGTAPAPSPLDQIDPNIIETIEVLKGPSAATLYGADAANGVIVITTKRGKPGPTRWTAHAEFGRTTPASAYPAGYYRWGHMPQTGFRMLCPLIDRYCVVDSLVRYQALNDPDMTILGRGHRTALSLTASGGSQALTYSVTGTYADETGLLQLPDFEIERFRTKFNREAPDWMRRPHHLKTWNVTSKVGALLGPTADVTLSTSLTRSDQQRTDLEEQQAVFARLYADKINGIYWMPDRVGLSSYWLVQASPNESYYRRRTASALTFTTGLNANWRPRTWFSAMGRAGLNVIPRDDEYLVPTGIPYPADSGALIRGTGRSLVSTFDLQGTLRKPLKWGFVFETGVGANLTTQGINDLVSSAVGLVPGTSSLSGAKGFYATDSRVNTSVFGWYLEPRLAGQRLSLSTGIRLDGGSAYGARLTRTGGGLFGGLLGLPKLNGSWTISEEPWFPFSGLFNSLRLRGAYGQAQVQPGATDRLRLYQRGTAGTGDLLQLNTLGNTELRPERATEFEGGFDTDLFDSRLSLEVTAYRKVTVDALMGAQLPSSVHGGGGIMQNVGNIRNTGLEIVTSVTPVQSALATWSAQLTYSRTHNVLTKLGSGVAPNPQQGIVAGYPVGGRWSRPILGYADRNGDGTIDLGEVQIGDSLVFMGRLQPAYMMTLSTNLELFHRALGITASFSHDAGATQIDRTLQTNWILSRALFDPTTPLAQQAAVVTYDSTTYGMTHDLSTFRFNSLSVTYHAPASVARLMHAQRLSIALQGSNLGLHSSYGGKDPDVSAWSPSEQIVDTGQLAQPRTWQLAVYLDF